MIERIGLVTLNYDHPQRGIERAFKGIFDADHVETFDYLTLQRTGLSIHQVNERFLDWACGWKPDWLFLQLQETGVIRGETLMEVRANLPRCVTSHWTGDMRPSISSYLASICRSTHITLASSVGQLSDFLAAGAPEVEYSQIGLDMDEDVRGIPEWEPSFRVPDVIFCGGHYGSAFPGTVERESAIKALVEAKIDVGIVGRGWPKGYPVVGYCRVKQQHHVWRKAKVALNINNFNGIYRYYSDRQLISMASGTPVVCKYVPGLEEEFKDGEECLFFRNEDQLVGNVQRLLADVSYRLRIGRAGRMKVIAEHTWYSRILKLLPRIESLRPIKVNA